MTALTTKNLKKKSLSTIGKVQEVNYENNFFLKF